VASWPSDGASLSVARHTLELTFDRPLKPETTFAVVWREVDGAPLSTSVSVDSSETRRLRVRLLEPAPGDYQLRWHAADAQSGESSEGAQSFTLQNESSAPPRVDVSPASADAGDRLELVGKGFARQSTVQLTIGDDEQSLATVQTDSRGLFNLEARVPVSVPYGMQPVSAVDEEGRTATGALQVHWGGWPPLVASNTGQPGPDKGEVTFTLNVRNRSDYPLEHVRLVLQAVGGATLVGANPSPQRLGDTLEWDIAVLDRGLQGPFRATYRSSAALVGHAWLQYRHRHVRGCAGDECLPAFISESAADSGQVFPLE
jgi:hypothetical protein